MSALAWLRKLRSHSQSKNGSTIILPVVNQIKAWRKTSRKMGWPITQDEFDTLKIPPELTDENRSQGFKGTVLFYGFGDDGSGNADAVLSGKLAWEYACKHRKHKTWQCEYVDFKKTEDIRLRPGAPARPRGFLLCRAASR